MNPNDPKIGDFLMAVERNHGEQLRQTCERLIEALPPGSELRTFNILARAKLQLRHSELEDLAAMNAASFDSGPDCE